MINTREKQTLSFPRQSITFNISFNSKKSKHKIGCHLFFERESLMSLTVFEINDNSYSSYSSFSISVHWRWSIIIICYLSPLFVSPMFGLWSINIIIFYHSSLSPSPLSESPLTVVHWLWSIFIICYLSPLSVSPLFVSPMIVVHHHHHHFLS